MTENADWRSKAAEEKLNALERPGFAWEFLRRNLAYRAAYKRIARRDANHHQADAEIARRWGLLYCPKPGSWRNRDTNLLAA